MMAEERISVLPFDKQLINSTLVDFKKCKSIKESHKEEPIRNIIGWEEETVVGVCVGKKAHEYERRHTGLNRESELKSPLGHDDRFFTLYTRKGLIAPEDGTITATLVSTLNRATDL